MAPREPAEAALAATGATVRAADASDHVAGVRPRWVVLPDSAEQVSAVLRASAEHDLAVVPRGGGTKRDWGAPPARCDVLLDTGRLNEVLEHAAGDLVARVQAGVTAEALAEVLAAKGQHLALDVPVPGSTIGGILATGIAGPRRFRHGTVRDLLIGITVVLADGTIARSGGKVVKNVAGYDLGKLFTGSYGTLGVIVEATFRLHPLPAARVWATADLDRPEEIGAIVQAVAASVAEPSAVELDWPDPAAPAALAVLVEGSAAAERAAAIRDLMGGRARIEREPPPWWGALPCGAKTGGPDEHAGQQGTLVEFRYLTPQLLATLVDSLRAAAAKGVRAAVRGSAAAGVLHIAPAPGTSAAAAADLIDGLRAHGARVTVLTAPDEVTRRVDRWGPVGAAALLRQVKDRFDPGGRMSPGRLVGGI